MRGGPRASSDSIMVATRGVGGIKGLTGAPSAAPSRAPKKRVPPGVWGRLGREKADELMVLRLSLGLLALLRGEGDKAAAEAAMRADEGLWVKRSGESCKASELGSTLDGFRAAKASARRLFA